MFGRLKILGVEHLFCRSQTAIHHKRGQTSTRSNKNTFQSKLVLNSWTPCQTSHGSCWKTSQGPQPTCSWKLHKQVRLSNEKLILKGKFLEVGLRSTYQMKKKMGQNSPPSWKETFFGITCIFFSLQLWARFREMCQYMLSMYEMALDHDLKAQTQFSYMLYSLLPTFIPWNYKIIQIRVENELDQYQIVKYNKSIFTRSCDSSLQFGETTE